MPIKFTTQCLTLFYRIHLFVRNDKRNGTGQGMVQVTHDIITEYILASFIQYTPNPITNPNIKKLEYKKLIFSKICQSDATKV